MTGFHAVGNSQKTEKFLSDLLAEKHLAKLDRWGRMGVSALAAATPAETGATARSWGYEIVRSKGRTTIHWTNSSENDGAEIVILIQYGHGTRGGTFVQGRDFINPAMRLTFDKIASDMWAEVKRM